MANVFLSFRTMLALSHKEINDMTHIHVIETSAGQVVTKITVCIDGVTIPVVPLSVAANNMGYSERHVRNLCNWQQLIAIKICNLWFVHEDEIELYPQTVRDKEAV